MLLAGCILLLLVLLDQLVSVQRSGIGGLLYSL